MTEGFSAHLQQHPVPLNETAIRQIRDSAMALDLYAWLALNPQAPGGAQLAATRHAFRQ